MNFRAVFNTRALSNLREEAVMSPIIWPPTLPQRPQSDPWAKNQPASRWTFEADEGPAMTRPKGTVGEKMSMTFVMTLDQWAQFRQFWKVGLNGGVIPFNYFDPDLNEFFDVRFDPSASEDFSVKERGPLHREVSMTWEVLP
jgi:hypothetical protein